MSIEFLLRCIKKYFGDVAVAAAAAYDDDDDAHTSVSASTFAFCVFDFTTSGPPGVINLFQNVIFCCMKASPVSVTDLPLVFIFHKNERINERNQKKRTAEFTLHCEKWM